MSFDSAQTAIPYSVNNSSGSTSRVGYGGRTVPVGMIHLVSLGKFKNVQHIEQAIITFAATNPFSQLGLGVNTIDFKNNGVSDSYDSSAGTYTATHTNTSGSLTTNSTANGAVDLHNNVLVNGIVTVGGGGTSSVVTGSDTYQSLNIPSTSFPETAMTAPSGTSLGNITVGNNATQTLSPGIYSNLTTDNCVTLNFQTGTYVFDNMLIGNNNIINVLSSPLTIYYKNSINVSSPNNNPILNNGGNPSSLIFYGTSTATVFNLGNNSVGYFVNYSPTVDIDLGNNTQFYGSIGGKDLTIGDNSALHYDRSLANFTPPVGWTGASQITVKSRW